jgi:L-threonylcarbamoyladenylate synthase
MRSLLQTSPDTLDEAARLLASGAVVILPTDTLYGFSGIVKSATQNLDTDRAIRAIKGRGETKPFIRLIASPADISSHTDAVIPPELLKHWPGPLTIVVPIKAGGTVAFRVPADPWLRSLITKLRNPIYSTSVNRAGSSPLTDPDAMSVEFSREVPLIVRAARPLLGPPSTLVALTAAGYTVLRKGALAL